MKPKSIKTLHSLSARSGASWRQFFSRSGLLNLAATLVLLLGLSVAPAAPPETLQGLNAQRSREYLGQVPNTEFFVAVVIEGEIRAARREVFAYVCDGSDGAFTFRGYVSRGVLDLRATEGPVRLQAVIGQDQVVGVVTFEDASHGFEAEPAHQWGGLYRVSATSVSRAEGISFGATRVVMQLTADREHLLVTAIRPDGTILLGKNLGPIPPETGTPVSFREHWVILLNDGSGRGGVIRSTQEGSEVGFSVKKIIMDY